jgi:hypothetical protein
MAQIAWQTPKGDLGTYPEESEFSYQLVANNSLASPLTYKVISGSPPPGIQLYSNGLLYGIPIITTPGQTSVYKYSFVVRAQNAEGQVADRNFNISINGLIPPRLVTPAGNLGKFFDSNFVSIPLEYIEVNPQAVLTWKVIAGELPPGINLTQQGVLTGFAEAPAAAGPAGTAAWDTGSFDQFVWDFEGATLSRTYNFNIQIYDGALYDQNSYSITIFATSFFRADNTLITCDADSTASAVTIFTADKDGNQYPTITTLATEIAPVRQNRSYAFQFKAHYPNSLVPVYWKISGSGPALFDGGAPPVPDDNGNSFSLVPFDNKSFDQANLGLPPGLILDKQTGWLTGNIGSVQEFKSDYNFQVVAYVEIVDSNTGEVTILDSTPVTYNIEILDSINNIITWETDKNLGSIVNGSLSTLSIRAVAKQGQSLTYSIKSGKYARLPQGLILLPSGHIAGRTSFDFYSMDRNSTSVILDNGTTSFDTVYTFTVLAEDASGYVYDTKTFTLTVKNVNVAPYENLYIRAFLTSQLRTQFLTTITDPALITDRATIVYRPDDPNFGLAQDIKFLAVAGINPSTPAEIIRNMSNHHRNKKINFDTLKLAYASDENFNPLYEVIYMDVLDYNDQAARTPSSNLRTLGVSTLPIIDDGLITSPVFGKNQDDGTVLDNVSFNEDLGDLGPISAIGSADNKGISFSNSFGNMTNEIIRGVGYEYQGALPAWMTSPQPDSGVALGFTRAVVIGYFLPGKGKEMLFRYKSSLTASGFGISSLINQYSFTADRYQLDSSLLVNYDFEANAFIPATNTLFDAAPSTGLIYEGPWNIQSAGTGNNLRSVAYGAGQYFAVGDHGTIVTSTSGSSWNIVTQQINLNYSSMISRSVGASTSTFTFAFGTPFSLGDEILNQGPYQAVSGLSSGAYITNIQEYVALGVPSMPKYAVVQNASVVTGSSLLIGLQSIPIGLQVGDYVTSANISIDAGSQVTNIFGNLYITVSGTSAVVSQYEPVQFQTKTAPIVTTIPANTPIEFTTYDGSTFVLNTNDTSGADGYVLQNSLGFSDISSVQAGYAVQVAGINTANLCAVTDYVTGSISSVVNLSIPTTANIASGTTITFSDAVGYSLNFVTANTTIAGATGITMTGNTFGIGSNVSVKTGPGYMPSMIPTASGLQLLVALTSVGNVRVGSQVFSATINNTYPVFVTKVFLGNASILINTPFGANSNVIASSETIRLQNRMYPRIATIAPGASVQALNTNVTVSSASTSAITAGSELFFKRVITSNANAGDTIINMSSTDNIGIGSLVVGSSITSTTVDTATWNAVTGTTLYLTIPSADITGVFPFVGMQVIGPHLPRDSVITSVINASGTTLITVKFGSTSVIGNPAYTTFTTGVATVTGTNQVVLVNSLTHINLNDYVQSANISLATRAQVTGVFGGNSSILISGSANLISTGETITVQSPAALTFVAQTIVPPATTVINKSRTSVTLNNALVAPLLIGYDSTLTFQLGTPQLNSIAYNGSTWLAVGSAGAVFQQSVSGVWSQSTASSYGDLTSVSYNPYTQTWVAVGTDGIILVATNTVYTVTSKTTQSVNITLASVAGLQVGMVASLSTGSVGILPGSTSILSINSGTNTITVSKLVTLDQNTNLVFNNLTWQDTDNLGISTTLRGITYAAGFFVVVGDNGIIIASNNNGTTWNSLTSGVTNNLYNVRYLNNNWYAVGTNGTLLKGVLRSSGTITWTKVLTNVTDTLYDISLSNNIFVIVGNRGTILNSTNGTNWYKVSTSVTDHLVSLAPNAPSPIAVGTTGIIVQESSQYFVNWAVRNVSFEMFNFNTLDQLRALGYPVKAGDTLVFAQQEGFDPALHRGPQYQNNGWNVYTDVFGSHLPDVGFGTSGFDQIGPVPGYYDNLNNPAVLNQQGGIWQVLLNDNNIAYLSFVRPVQPGQVISVKSDNSQILYSADISSPATVPYYVYTNKVVNSTYKATTFDAGGTRFSSPRDTYLSDPNTNDKYLKFTSTGVSL